MFNYLLFALLSFFWGGSFIAIKYLITEVPSFTGAFYRVFFSVIFLILLSLLGFAKKIDFSKIKNKGLKKELLFTIVTGLFSVGIPFSLLFWGEKFIIPSLAGVINGTVPFWTLIISILLFNGYKDLTLKKVIGLALGFAGIVFIFGPKISFSGNVMELWGLVAVTGMAMSYSMGINLNKKVLAENQIFTGTLNIVTQQVASFIYLFMVLIFTDGLPEWSLLLKPANGLSVLYLSLFSTAIAFIIFYRLITIMGPVKASTVTFFVPPVALLLDNLVYGSTLSYTEGLGALVILTSMYFLKENNGQKPVVTKFSIKTQKV